MAIYRAMNCTASYGVTIAGIRYCVKSHEPIPPGTPDVVVANAKRYGVRPLEPGEDPPAPKIVKPEEMKREIPRMVIATSARQRLSKEFPVGPRTVTEDDGAEQPKESVPAATAGVTVTRPAWKGPKAKEKQCEGEKAEPAPATDDAASDGAESAEEKPKTDGKKSAKRARKKEGAEK